MCQRIITTQLFFVFQNFSARMTVTISTLTESFPFEPGWIWHTIFKSVFASRTTNLSPISMWSCMISSMIASLAFLTSSRISSSEMNAFSSLPCRDWRSVAWNDLLIVNSSSILRVKLMASLMYCDKWSMYI